MPWSRSALSAIAVAFLASGCVTLYQPLTSLQKPTAIEPAAGNFEGQRMLIRCHPGEVLRPGDAQKLCAKLAALFASQGAQVETAVPQRGGAALPELAGGARPDLVMELRSRLLHEENPIFLWAVCVATCSVIPAYSELSFAQDVSIRDASGFELAADSLQARIVTYTGAGIWTVNRTLDLLLREERDELTGDAPKRDFSRDFYRQINQLAFNARVRAAVLRGFEPATGAPPSAEKERG